MCELPLGPHGLSCLEGKPAGSLIDGTGLATLHLDCLIQTAASWETAPILLMLLHRAQRKLKWMVIGQGSLLDCSSRHTSQLQKKWHICVVKGAD